MFKDLLAVLGGAPTLSGAAEDFREMTRLAREMTLTASKSYWEAESGAARARSLADQDARMNDLQCQIRKSVILHLSGSEPADVPYCLLLMSLVKDVERIGDYAKNLVSIPELVGQVEGRLPDDEVVAELRGFAEGVEALAGAAPQAYEGDDAETATELLRVGRERSKRSNPLLRRVAAGSYDAATATRLTLTVRFYKRIQGHFLNLLSSMLMPLDRLDQFDDSALG